MGTESRPASSSVDVIAPRQRQAESDAAESDRQELDRQAVERLIEEDRSLAPTRPSTLLVEPSVLDPLEVQALLAGLSGALLSASEDADAVAAAVDSAVAEMLADGSQSDEIGRAACRGGMWVC